MQPARGARSIESRVFAVALLMGWLWGAPGTADAAGGAGDVRPLQPRGRQLVARGAQRSATFRHLLEQVAATDLIVYVDVNPFHDLRLEGALRFVGTSDGVRYVIVWVRSTRFEDKVIATLAHELRHAVEVGGAPEVRSQRALARLYEAIGHSDHRGHVESDAAQAVARRVARELSLPASGLTDPPQSRPLEPCRRRPRW
jgi:hypothetical protein